MRELQAFKKQVFRFSKAKSISYQKDFAPRMKHLENNIYNRAKIAENLP